MPLDQGISPVDAGPRQRIWSLGCLAVVLAWFLYEFHGDVLPRDSFSWMDPYQYFDFARTVRADPGQWNQFAVPSLFPFLLIPFLQIRDSVSASLWVNATSALVLLLVTSRLLPRRLRNGVPLLALLLLSSPLLLGLSRTGYVEFTLTAMFAGGMLAWVRFLESGATRALLAFAGILALGFMTKMTFPMYFFLPVLGGVVKAFWDGNPRRAVLTGTALVLALSGALVVQHQLFPASFPYYTSLGNTRIPIMRLIGPPEWMSWDSSHYCFTVLARWGLGWIAPVWFVVVLAPLALRKSGDGHSKGLPPELESLPPGSADSEAANSSRTWIWWLALLGPLVLLTFQPVKEPRHLAPCVVPAMLLAVEGVNRWRNRRVRGAAMAGLGVIALTQSVALTRSGREIPYLFDQPTHFPEIRDQLFRHDPLGDFYRNTPNQFRALHWAHNQNVILDGFSSNAALSLTWQLRPAIVFDRQVLEAADRASDQIPYSRFEDLFFLTSFNAYNRRAGWHAYLETLSREQVLEHATTALVCSESREQAQVRYPDLQWVGEVGSGESTVQLLCQREIKGATYRQLYAREFLKRASSLSSIEQNTIAREAFYAACLAGRIETAQRKLERSPELRNDQAVRNIYWTTGAYQPLHRQVVPELFARYQEELPGAGD